MPNLVIQHNKTIAASEGHTRATDLDLSPLAVALSDDKLEIAEILPDMIGRDNWSSWLNTPQSHQMKGERSE